MERERAGRVVELKEYRAWCRVYGGITPREGRARGCLFHSIVILGKSGEDGQLNYLPAIYICIYINRTYTLPRE